MNTEPDLASAQTVRQPVPTLPEPGTGRPPADPLAKIMMSPRTFLTILAVTALLLGLLLALLPVRVANVDARDPGHVSCGNTIGGVETGPLAARLGRPGDEVLATYVNTCESAIATRLVFSWPMFLVGALAIVWSGVVRRPTAPVSPG
ncbi:hypothetical protein [Actinophytocola glycyrrhizae]|uniref:Uncharacterized protein n=1 Tax=Actinophytocola glycyrrhizae TaxID=2044873 RepID=A0ABV9S039_9PSEU